MKHFFLLLLLLLLPVRELKMELESRADEWVDSDDFFFDRKGIFLSKPWHRAW